MSLLLLNELVASTMRVEIAREFGATQATLTVKNDVKIERELRTRSHKTKIRATSVPDSAYAFFNIMVEKLKERGLRCGEPQLHNLPKLPPDQTDCSATVTIEIGKRSDDELRETFMQTAIAAQQEMGAARYKRRAGRTKWTNTNAANNPELGGL